MRHDSVIARPRVSGFTLIELVTVIIILAVLAAVAVPKFIDMGKSARVASLQALAGALNSTAINVHAMCKTNPACDYGLNYQHLLIGGRWADLNYGWLDGGDSIGGFEIDAWVNYSGFTVSIPGGNATFTLDDAPDPTNCFIKYEDVYFRGPAALPIVSVFTNGC